jgi:hypothetical protein
MQIHELDLNIKQVILCRKSREAYFLVYEGVESTFNPEFYNSMAAFWSDTALFEPDFPDAELEKAWDAYCERHDAELEQEGLSFDRILSFLEEQDRPDLQALDCMLEGRKQFSRCILVLSEEFMISALSE